MLFSLSNQHRILTALILLIPFSDGFGQKISVGKNHSVALRNDGIVFAWGNNDYGQCDVPGGLTDVIDITSGVNHSLLLRSDGSVVAWGSNEHNQCRVPDNLRNAIAICAGQHHSAALQSDGKVVAWGSNLFNQCDVPPWVDNVSKIESGQNHTLALRHDGTVVSWGKCDENQCEVPGWLKDVIKISAGENHSLALTKKGTVVAWGSNEYELCNVPGGLHGVIEIEAGKEHCIALKSNGTVKAWGNKKQKRTSVPETLEDVKVISAGHNHSLALKEDGTIVAWGSAGYRKCEVPKKQSNFIAIKAGENHSLAITQEGAIVAWGSNQFGECDVPEEVNMAYLSKTEEQVAYAPPILLIDSTKIEFIDEDSNGKLDALERALVRFTIENVGPGAGVNLELNAKISGNTEGVIISEIPRISPILPNESINVEIPIETSNQTQDGEILLFISIKETNGFSPNPIKLNIQTRSAPKPKIEVVQFASSPTIWKANNPIELYAVIENTGSIIATDIDISLLVPGKVNCYSNNSLIKVTSLEPGESKKVSYDIIVPRNFDEKTVDINITTTEKFGKYGTSNTQQFPFMVEAKIAPTVSLEKPTAIVEAVEMSKQSNLQKQDQSSVSFNQVPKDFPVTTVAVMPIDGKDCDGAIVNGQDIASFTEGSLLGIYNIVERRNLERVLDEQKLALSGLIYEKSAVEAGCNVGAQGIIFTEYGCLTGQKIIQLKLVDCQTSELYWSATGINATAKETLDKVREELQK